MSEVKKSPSRRQRPGRGGLVLATVLSVIGACAMAGSILIENLTRRFPSNGNFNAGFNVTRTFNATRTFNPQLAAERVPTSFTYASWLNILGFGCLVGIAIILVALLFQSRSKPTSGNLKT